MGGYPGMDAGGQQQSPPEAGSPNTHHDPSNGGGDQNGPPSNYTDINQILDQILNITDQSLDEAQVRTVIIGREPSLFWEMMCDD
jgi:hypothetical protein